MAVPFASYAGKIPTEGQADYVDRISQAFTNLDTDMGDIETRISANESITTHITVTGAVDLDTDSAKLAGIEAAAKDDQTDAEIRAAIAAATDSNVYDDAAAAIVAAAANTTGTNTGDQDKTDIDALGINADTVDGVEAAEMAKLSTDNSYTGRQNFTDFSEAAQSVGVSGTPSMNAAEDTYFYTSSSLSGQTVQYFISNPATTGRVTTITFELLGAGLATSLTWSTSIKWPGGSQPTWSNGKDIVSFSTRDGGTNWLGYYAGGDFS